MMRLFTKNESMLLSEFNDAIIDFHVRNDILWAPKGILLIEKKMQIKPNFIYIGSFPAAKILCSTISAPIDSIFIITCAKQQYKDNSLPGYLNYIIINTGIEPLYNHISSFLANYSEMNRRQIINKAKIRNILEGNITEDNKIAATLSSLTKDIKEYSTLISICFKNPLNKLDIAICEENIKKIFCNSITCQLDGRIHVLYLHEKKYNKFPFDIQSKLSGVLKKYDGYAFISMQIRNFSQIHTHYKLLYNMIDIEAKIPLANDTNILLYADYNMWYVVKLCCQQYEQIFGNDELPYLGHPAIITLKRYDARNNTDLCDTLFHYLMNDRSTSKTAEATFSHRNTVQYKIKKIMTIIDDDLSEGKSRYNMIFSYMLFDYYEKYQGEAIKK